MIFPLTGVSALELATKKHPYASSADVKAQFDLMNMVIKQDPPKLPVTHTRLVSLADVILSCFTASYQLIGHSISIERYLYEIGSQY